MIFGLPWTWVAGAIVVTFLGGFLGGCEVEKRAFDVYKAKVEATAEAQKREAEDTNAFNKKQVEETKNDYEKRIADIRNYYRRMHDNGTSPVPGQSTTPGGVDATPSYDVLIEQCAETTQQLVSLQHFEETTR